MGSSCLVTLGGSHANRLYQLGAFLLQLKEQLALLFGEFVCARNGELSFKRRDLDLLRLAKSCFAMNGIPVPWDTRCR